MAAKPAAVVRAVLLALICAAVLAFLFVSAISGLETEFAAMNMHGWLALGLGAGLTLLLGVGLMTLVFFSARKGYDDRVAEDPMAPDPDQREPD
ncbi:MAG: hypothetical protein HXY28_14350 [Hydrogenophilaceae bacterium]|jgi:hypothetical protein|nr:hypothetical protein [Hydrogenophilaceae bacterium]